MKTVEPAIGPCRREEVLLRVAEDGTTVMKVIYGCEPERPGFSRARRK